MKVAVIFDSDPQGGGGFYQSLKTIETLKNSNVNDFEFEIVTTNLTSKKDIEKKGYKSTLFAPKKWSNLYYKLTSSKILNVIINKLKIKNPFTSFLKKNNFDLIYFLGPSSLINLCEEHNFVVNVYDINHKLDNFFPEYKKKNVINNREDIMQNCINKSFSIIVDSERTKDEIKFAYNCFDSKIEIVPFNPYLPSYYEKNKNKIIDNIDFKKFNFLKKNKTFFYPAQFWAHKNHNYIVESAKILYEKGLNFNVIFCGSNKGNYSYIVNKINKYNLQENFKIFDFLTDEEVIYLYLNTSAIIIPTYVARSTLPLYESFYFEKTIFYSKDVLEKKLENLVFPFNLNDPSDLSNQLQNFIIGKNNQQFNSKLKDAKKYYLNNCDEKHISKKIFKIFQNYKYLSERWSQ